jgi:phosphotransferase system  glucose/maltose/N-acetylglucosamine-specific IIC component
MKIWEILENYVFPSVILTNFAIFGAKFAIISTSHEWKNKKKSIVYHTTPLWIDIRRLVQIV